MKTEAVFKRAFNQTVDLIADYDDGDPLPSENALRAKLGVSRTTVRKVISTLNDRGIVTGGGKARIVRSQTKSIQWFPEAETVPQAAQVEKRFMEWMLRDNARPGTSINELELARQFGIQRREFVSSSIDFSVSG